MKGIPRQNYGKAWVNEGYTTTIKGRLGDMKGIPRQNYGQTWVNEGHTTSKLRAGMGKLMAYHVKIMGIYG
jgi:hypothetical protein